MRIKGLATSFHLTSCFSLHHGNYAAQMGKQVNEPVTLILQVITDISLLRTSLDHDTILHPDIQKRVENDIQKLQQD